MQCSRAVKETKKFDIKRYRSTGSDPCDRPDRKQKRKKNISFDASFLELIFTDLGFSFQPKFSPNVRPIYGEGIELLLAKNSKPESYKKELQSGWFERCKPRERGGNRAWNSIFLAIRTYSDVPR